jgi:hypothetical protein
MVLRRGRRELLRCLALALLPDCARAGISEDQLKAAFLLNFLAYVDWPAARLSAEPYVIATLVPDGVHQALLEGSKGRKVQGRGIEVRQATRPYDTGSPHLLFVAAGTALPAEAMRAFSAASVLVVGESEQLLRDGAVIRFVLVDTRLRFDINLPNAEQAGLKLSAKLLQMARQVLQRSP